MTSPYRRSTSVADLSDLPRGLRDALRNHAQSHQLTITDGLPAWLTRSENPPSSSLLGRAFKRRANSADPDAEHQTLVIVHPTHLIVAISGAVRGESVLSGPLVALSVARRSIPHADRVSDAEAGLSITGLRIESGETGSFYVGLGPEQAGHECADAVRAAIDAAKNPG
ncbi:hypothetical protein [Gordonia sp. NPDC003376]